MRISFKVIVYLSVFAFSSNLYAESAKLIKFACGMRPQNPTFQAVKSVMTQALAPLGYEFQMIHVPRARGEALFRSGVVDGSCGKTDLFYDAAIDVRRIRPEVATSELTVFARKPLVAHDLTGNIFRMYVVRGSPGISNYLKSKGFRSSYLTNLQEGFKMMAANRSDFLVEYYEPGTGALSVLGEDVSSKINLIPTGSISSVYIGLHKSKEFLLGGIEEQIRAMLHNGYSNDYIFRD